MHTDEWFVRIVFPDKANTEILELRSRMTDPEPFRMLREESQCDYDLA